MTMTTPATTGALAPYRVLDLTEGGLGLGPRLLADLGADVIRIEPPAGSPSRCRGPFFQGCAHPERSLSWVAFNFNKRGVTLDLATAEGRDLFLRLAATADVCFESAGPGAFARLGLDAATLRAANPGLVVTSITPFGESGPYREHVATDLTFWALAGVLAVSGDPERPPIRVSVPLADLITGNTAAAGAMVALWRRVNGGEAQSVAVSEQVAVVWANTFAATHGAANSTLLRTGAFRDVGYTRFRQLFRCKDGYLNCFLMQGNWGEAFNRKLAAWMDEDGMLPPALRDFNWLEWTPTTKLRRGDVEGAQAEVALVEEPVARFFETKTKFEIFRRALADELLLAPVFDSRDIYAWEHFQARGFWQEMDCHEWARALRLPGAFVTMGATPVTYRRPAPRIGEHNHEIYVGELGLSEADYERHRARGVV